MGRSSHPAGAVLAPNTRGRTSEAGDAVIASTRVWGEGSEQRSRAEMHVHQVFTVRRVVSARAGGA